MRNFEASREHAEEDFAARRMEAFKKTPRLQEIEKKLGEIGLTLARLALSGNANALEEARKKSDALKEERLSLISKKGLAKTYFLPQYSCANCADTGYILGANPIVACACLKQKLIDEYYSLSNMREVLRDENFDNFDIRLFSEKIIENEGLSPRSCMEINYKMAISFVQKFDDEFANLLLYGETGLGKTFICHCIAKDLLDIGKTVLYLTVPRLCKVIENSRFNRDSLDSPDEMLNAVDTVDLLILDDLGTEVPTVITSAALFDIINQRLLTRKPTVISTNLSPNDLATIYSERMVSRFLGNYQMIKFFGEDIRTKKKYRGQYK
jgi:DNA replication protein DnaC